MNNQYFCCFGTTIIHRLLITVCICSGSRGGHTCPPAAPTAQQNLDSDYQNSESQNVRQNLHLGGFVSQEDKGFPQNLNLKTKETFVFNKD